MKYAVWNDGSLIHARNLDNVREVETTALPIPADAVLVEAESGKQAVEKSGLKSWRKP